MCRLYSFLSERAFRAYAVKMLKREGVVVGLFVGGDEVDAQLWIQCA